MRGKNKVRVIYKSKKEYGVIQNEDALNFLNFESGRFWKEKWL